MFLRTNHFKLIFLFLALTITACGGGGGGSTTPTATVSEGKFIDSAVEGMTYTSGAQSGLTDATGLFSYETGKTVTFSIGDIVIGTVSGTAIVTPVQLIANATDQTNTVVTNIVQFLMTIDDDHDPSNGIKITQAIRDAAVGLTIDFTLADFDTNSNVSSVVDTLTTASTLGNQVLVTNAAAQTHLGDSLFSLLTGTYAGTFAGSDTGTWTITIATNGTISGTGSSATGASLVFSGSIVTSGSITASSSGGSSSGSTWSGTINIATGGVSGNWSLSGTGLTGTYTGSKK